MHKIFAVTVNDIYDKIVMISMTYLHDVFNDVIDFQEEFEDICNSRRGHVSQEVG